jgi:hypothetical protein
MPAMTTLAIPILKGPFRKPRFVQSKSSVHTQPQCHVDSYLTSKPLFLFAKDVLEGPKDGRCLYTGLFSGELPNGGSLKNFGAYLIARPIKRPPSVMHMRKLNGPVGNRNNNAVACSTFVTSIAFLQPKADRNDSIFSWIKSRGH